MSQETIVKILKNEKRPVSAKEMLELSGIGRSTISSNLKKLRLIGEVGHIKLKQNKKNKMSYFFLIEDLEEICAGSMKKKKILETKRRKNTKEVLIYGKVKKFK